MLPPGNQNISVGAQTSAFINGYCPFLTLFQYLYLFTIHLFKNIIYEQQYPPIRTKVSWIIASMSECKNYVTITINTRNTRKIVYKQKRKYFIEIC